MAVDEVEAWMEEDFGERWASLASGVEEGDETDIFKFQLPAEDDGAEEPLPLAVVEKDLPAALFGFTRRDSSHVVVNRNLYRIDKERTVRHEKAHHRFPKDELTIRYINGDPEVRNTLSFQANNPGRLGHGSRGVPVTGNAAAYGDSYGSGSKGYI